MPDSREVAAERESLRFYVDESALGIGKTLAAARKDTIHVGHPLIPECPLGVDDTNWIPAVATRGLVVIARDKRIRTRLKNSDNCAMPGFACSGSPAARI